MRTNSRPVNNARLLWLVLAAWLCLPGFVFSQDSFLDSLLTVLENSKPDSNQAILLTDIAWELKFDDPQQANSYLDRALELSRNINFPRGEGTALNFKGVVADIHGDSDDAADYFQQALVIRQELGDRKGVASLYNNIGNVRENQGEYLSALDNYRKSLAIREELGDTARMVRAFYNIAILHENMGNYPEALEYIFQYLEFTEFTYDDEAIANGWNIVGNVKTEIDRLDEALEAYEKALSLHRKLGNDWAIASVLNNIANLRDGMAEQKMDDDILGDSVKWLFDESVRLHEEALAIRQNLEDTSGIAEIYNNMGYVLKNVGSFYKKSGEKAQAEATWEEAERYLRLALAIREEMNDKSGIMQGLNGIADVRRRQKRFTEALPLTEQYYAIAIEIEDKKFQQNALKDLARIHYNLGNFETAYDYRKDYDELRYERFNEDRIKNEERREIVYSDRKKQYEIDRQKQEIRLQDAELNNARLVQNSLIGGGALLLLLAGVLFNRNKIIRLAKKRSDDLLLNILPAQTAEELKKNGTAKARKYDSVSILFTDFQSFTTIAEQTTPEELVAEIDTCFRAFDDIISKYQIEKIKTIGDAYLCASGLPTPTANHASNIVQAALDIQKFMEELRAQQRAEGKHEFHCRIGVHTGPVIAGVVGKKKFAYDIWGDAVNMAARMEQSSEPDQINISRATYELVAGEFDCLYRGKVAAKNKGELDMYFVKGVKAKARIKV